MRIISKFKDYYDSAMGLGVDLTTVFSRNMEYLCGENFSDNRPLKHPYLYLRHYIPLDSFTSNKDFVEFEQVSIFFCGKVYRGITIKLSKRSEITWSYDVHTRKTFYKVEDLNEFMQTHKLEDLMGELTAFRGTRRNQAIASMFKGPFDDRDFIEEMRKERTVISMYGCRFHRGSSRGEYVIKNPKLSDVEFYKVFPPSQAFQEIDMYISGVLAGPNQEPLPISDKDRIFQHGFDKLSFRKGPTPGRKKFRTG